jgi:hypothetical protein
MPRPRGVANHIPPGGSSGPQRVAKAVVGGIGVLAAVVTVIATASLLIKGGGGDKQVGRPPPFTADPSYQNFKKRCEGAGATVRYKPNLEGTRGEDQTVGALVTLDPTPSDEILGQQGETASEGILVSCTLNARLLPLADAFDVDNENWIPGSLKSADTVKWYWGVTPKIGGDHSLLLEVRPFMEARDQDSLTGDPSSQPYTESDPNNVQRYKINAHVNVPWFEKPLEWTSRIAALLNAGESVVKALGLFIAAVIALGATLGIRRHRRQTPGRPQTT